MPTYRHIRKSRQGTFSEHNSLTHRMGGCVQEYFRIEISGEIFMDAHEKLVDAHVDDGSAGVREEADLPAVIRSLVSEFSNPTRLLEIYYWSQEPGAVEFMRKVMLLRPQTRMVILSFLAMTSDPKLIVADVDEVGQVILSSPQVAETVGRLRALRDTPPTKESTV
jgi:hypothetical protein